MELGHWAVAAIISKAGIYATALLCAGSAIFWTLFDRESRLFQSYAALILSCAFVAILFSIAQISFQAGLLIDDGLAGMVDPEMLILAADGPLGHAALCRMIGLLIIVVGVLSRAARGWMFALGAVLTSLSFSLVGHATAAPQVLLSAVITAHLLAIIFWIGALLPLYAGALRAPDHAANVAHRFGKIAVFIVPVLIAMGLLFIAIRIGGPQALIGSHYGGWLLLKIVLVAVLLLLAAANKFKIVPKLQSGDFLAAAQLRRSILTEALCFVAVLTMTAILTTMVQLPG